MKTLVIIAHPNIEESRVNKRWLEEIKKHPEEFTVHEIYKRYPDWSFDIEYEQNLLLEHDRYIFQFPFYWYSSPPLLKKWFDEVLEYGFAYGSKGDKLQGKEFGLAISAGVAEKEYQAGAANEYTLSELLKPYQASCLYTGMKFLPTFAVYGAEHNNLSDEKLEESARNYILHMQNFSKEMKV
ncbi:NAD(P)H-dependent oxidoreductase [Bacillus cereus group sp. BfR-BA-01331]|uniref:NAD(P)H-dependent oxidoreductase n=1 Tax=Bacillus cereus group sp. BfR-BA-01331 TaxID=2920307 RepID=UPI001F571D61|nr:NAD(P)H-dependent oxidoreductase [Bacillus cereus group sp. BfR-BA-01331]